jgi:hypothetical protein
MRRRLRIARYGSSILVHQYLLYLLYFRSWMRRRLRIARYGSSILVHQCLLYWYKCTGFTGTKVLAAAGMAPEFGGKRLRLARCVSSIQVLVACWCATVQKCLLTSAYVSIRQHTSAYVSIRQHTSAYVSIRQAKCLLLLMQPYLPADDEMWLLC